MSSTEKIKKKLHNALKLSGFSIRKDFSSYIVDAFVKGNVCLEDNSTFDIYVKSICSSLEKQCLINKSIEKQHIERVVEIALNSGYDKQESTFNVINAFDFPKFNYDPDRKIYLPATSKSILLSSPNSKTELFVERYSTILQRTLRNFKNRDVEKDKLTLQTVDYLLTKNCLTLNKTVILGSILQVSEGKYYLEDPSGIVELDLSHAKYYGGFFVENSFILVDGYYEDKILQVATVLLPPGEEYKDSVLSFGNFNYFGGSAFTALRNSQNLEEQLQHNQSGSIFFLSDVWLDHDKVFEKLDELFSGLQYSSPIAFVFMGNFIQEYQGLEKMDHLKKLFKKFGELLGNYPELTSTSKFVFIPGMTDPCNLHILPRFSLPTAVTEDFKKIVPNAIFATNPCRLQSYTREITLMRADIIMKLIQCSLYKPEKEDRINYVTRTIISQGHLTPFSLNALTVHWDFDYTLRLYPLPNLIVLGDKTEAYAAEYKGCQVINPGPFCDGFQFKCYTPFTNQVDDCGL
ncbi:hypothetical protein RN001_000703 [Aquatica leii]|uniref:DNA polymerase epsilon subunit n=1 Tax=Aquatica leii TaxID=1421715 RepID=A0AAN7SJ97_9COLE|nr:hypothetical protein RN001_000703 [Aquatica leii]